jgi:PAS domain S-box-containing protein
MPLTRSDLPNMEKPEWLTQMETVLEVLNEGVLIHTEEEKVLFVNSAFLEMTGMTREEMIGANPSKFYSASEMAYLTKQREIGCVVGHNRFVFVLPQKDGTRLPVIVGSRAIEKDGHFFVIVTCTDISEQVRAETELRAAHEKLQKRQLEIEEDLRLAARVQNSLAPLPLVWDTLTVDSFYRPVHSIGGDFAMVSALDRQHLGLLVCDVSGHGIGSALVASRIYSETIAHLRGGMPFLDMFDELNRFLIEDIGSSGLYVTVAAARIDVPRRTMTFAGAGHPPVMLARRGREPLLLESRSMVLGALPEAVDATSNMEIELEPDDRVVLYTDGITEAFNSRGQMLGISGVQEIVRESSSLPPGEMKQGILDGVAAWREGPPTDDVSLILVHVL